MNEYVTVTVASTTVTLAVDTTGSDGWIRLAGDSGLDHDPFDDFDVHQALARRPVIRDQGPPPVRRQPTPRAMRPPPRRLSWLVEGRGR